MQSTHYRKVELQSPADLTYLYTNTVALSRQKLDLHFPPSAYSDGDNPDPMKERVKELVDQFIRQTYTHASDSISINGLEFDSSSTATAGGGPFPFPSAFSAPETVEYEQYDSELASRVSSLYAQLESLTTTVAQLRRDAPGKAAKTFADALNDALSKEDAEFEAETLSQHQQWQGQGMNGEQENGTKMDIDKAGGSAGETTNGVDNGTEADSTKVNPDWKLNIPFGTDLERERWFSGEMAEVYTDTLRTLLRLQGEDMELEGEANMDSHAMEDNSTGSNNKAISTTVATAERAQKAVEVVEKM